MVNPSEPEKCIMAALSSSLALSDWSSPILTRSHTLPRLNSTRKQSITSSHPDIGPDDLESLRKWIIAISIVNFDIDIGPVISNIYPHLSLTASEAETIAFSSFPDSTSPGTHTRSLSFRTHITKLSYNLKPSGSTLPPPVYGFVAFKQTREPSVKRGYLQISVTVLSHHPYPELFSELASRILDRLSKNGKDVLRDACEDIIRWPTISERQDRLDLRLFDSRIGVLTADLSSNNSSSRLNKVPNGNQIHLTLPSSPTTVISCIAPILPSMWRIWECIALCKPILILGPSPDIVSGIVWWLRELSRTVFFDTDFRPCLTLQDQDYTSLMGEEFPKGGILLGVTNPLIQRRCQRWPHVVDVRSAGSGPNSSSTSTEWRSAHRRLTSKDRSVLKRIETLFGAGVTLRVEGLFLLRQHFHSRGNEFLTPLNQYFNSLILPPSTSSPSSTTSSTIISSHSLRETGTATLVHISRPFHKPSFMTYLNQHGTPLPCRSARQRNQLYDRWIETPNFGSWMKGREEEVRRAFGLATVTSGL